MYETIQTQLITADEAPGRPIVVRTMSEIKAAGGHGAICRFPKRATIGNPTKLFARRKGILVSLMLKPPN